MAAYLIFQNKFENHDFIYQNQAFDFWRTTIINPKNCLDNCHGFAITLCGYNVFDISLGKGI